jgi:hypothetical protein
VPRALGFRHPTLAGGDCARKGQLAERPPGREYASLNRHGEHPNAMARSHLVQVDPVVRRFNALNSAIVALVPAVAVASDTLNRVVPLLRQMQQLLSQSPCGTGTEYRMLTRRRGIVVGAVQPSHPSDIPNWSTWLGARSFVVRRRSLDNDCRPLELPARCFVDRKMTTRRTPAYFYTPKLCSMVEIAAPTSITLFLCGYFCRRWNSFISRAASSILPSLR